MSTTYVVKKGDDNDLIPYGTAPETVKGERWGVWLPNGTIACVTASKSDAVKHWTRLRDALRRCGSTEAGRVRLVRQRFAIVRDKWMEADA